MLKTYIFSQFFPTFLDYPDPDSVAVLVYFIGCEHKCIDCHNESFKVVNHGNENIVFYDLDTFVRDIKKECRRSLTNKVVLSGGDCLAPANIEFTKAFLKYRHDLCITIYTGYPIEYVIENNVKGFSFIKTDTFNKDLLQDSTKTDFYIQLSSKNQNIYDSYFKLLSKNGRYTF